jgi:hypothetical protein
MTDLVGKRARITAFGNEFVDCRATLEMRID